MSSQGVCDGILEALRTERGQVFMSLSHYIVAILLILLGPCAFSPALPAWKVVCHQGTVEDGMFVFRSSTVVDSVPLDKRAMH